MRLSCRDEAVELIAIDSDKLKHIGQIVRL